MSLRLRAFFFAWVCFMILGFVALRRVALGCVWFYVFFVLVLLCQVLVCGVIFCVRCFWIWVCEFLFLCVCVVFGCWGLCVSFLSLCL